MLPALHAAQELYGYIPEPCVHLTAERLNVYSSQIFGVLTFYAQFHLKPRGRHIIRVCRGTACHVRGSLKLLDKVKEMLKVEENGTTEDLRYTLEPVACLGACGLAPVMMVDEETHGRLVPEKLGSIIDQYA